MRKIKVLLAAAVATLVVAIPASAVMFGQPDGDGHPQVGLVVFYDASGSPLWRCTGALLSPTVFLTAGHCTSGTASARVWFDASAPAGYPFRGGVTGKTYAHPKYSDFAEFPANYDIGVVVLKKAVKGVQYAQLAAEGTLDSLATGTARDDARFDLVGYGLQDALPPVFSTERTRYAGEAKLVNLQSANNAGYNVQLTAASGTGGALCFGDSGGPVFLKGTLTVVAVNSFVLNSQCMGSGFSYRTDTADSLAFIGGF